MPKVKQPKKTKILLIDDDPTLRKVYEMQFESYPQYQLLLADSVMEMEQIIKKEKPALVLLDLIIGKKKGVPIEETDKQNGFNILSFLKNTPGLKQVPVVIFSNLDNDQDRQRAMNLGATDYWVKSLMVPSEVMEKIKDRLELEAAKEKVYQSAARLKKLGYK